MDLHELAGPPLDRIKGYHSTQEIIGKSGDAVFRLTAPERPTLIAKISNYQAGNNLRDEASRLRWLRSVGVMTPEVVDLGEVSNQSWLLMECLPGENAAIANAAPETITKELAAALRSLHSLDPHVCPFDETLGVKLARAEQNVLAGKVDETDFDRENLGKTAKELFRELMVQVPDEEGIVVVHGDACLPNIMLHEKRFVGFIDCGKTGRSDRYQDLALACHSITFNLGDQWVAPFLDAYGLTGPDHSRLHFYRMLDEFF